MDLLIDAAEDETASFSDSNSEETAVANVSAERSPTALAKKMPKVPAKPPLQTLVVSCGLFSFEQTEYATKDCTEFSTNVLGMRAGDDRPSRWQRWSLQDPETKQILLDSFKKNYPDLVRGRKIVVIDCTTYKDPGDMQLRGHVGYHPRIMQQIVEDQRYKQVCEPLKEIDFEAEAALILCCCNRVRHRSVAVATTIWNAIKVLAENETMQTPKLIHLSEGTLWQRTCAGHCKDCGGRYWFACTGEILSKALDKIREYIQFKRLGSNARGQSSRPAQLEPQQQSQQTQQCRNVERSDQKAACNSS